MIDINHEIQSYMYLIDNVIKREFNKVLFYMEYAELYSLGLEGLWRGVESYDETVEKVIHYSQNIRLKIKREIVRRVERKNQEELHQFHTCSLTKRNGTDWELQHHHDDFSRLEFIEFFNELTKNLTQDEVLVVNLLSQGYKQREIAQELNISQQAVSKKIKGIKAKLKAYQD